MALDFCISRNRHEATYAPPRASLSEEAHAAVFAGPNPPKGALLTRLSDCYRDTKFQGAELSELEREALDHLRTTHCRVAINAMRLIHSVCREASQSGLAIYVFCD